MDKKEFNDLFYNLQPGGLHALWNGLQEIRKSFVQEARVRNRTVDYVLVQTMTGLVPGTGIESVCPGITDRLQNYLILQEELIANLHKIQRVINKETAPFKQFLERL